MDKNKNYCNSISSFLCRSECFEKKRLSLRIANKEAYICL